MADDREIKVGHTYHIALHKNYLIGLIKEDQDASYLVGFEPDEIAAALKALEEAPEYITGCQNVDEDGRCLGHPPEED